MASSLPSVGSTLSGIQLAALLRGDETWATYRGTDRLGQSVQVTVALEEALAPHGGADGFLARVRALTDARHQNLLPYSTGGAEDGLVFAVARHDDAPGLDEKLGRGGALAADRVLSIGAGIAEALAALEAAGCRHGDLTPRRVLLPGRGAVLVRPARVLPVGLAPRRRRYHSPEEVRGDDGDIRSDLFVLGLVLAEAAVGKHPIAGSAVEVKRAIGSGSIPRVRSYLPDADPRLRVALNHLLVADPSGRYGSAREAAGALADLAGADSAPAPAAPVARPAAPVAAPAVPVVPAAAPAAAPPPPAEEERPKTAPIAVVPAGEIPVLGAAEALPAAEDVKRIPGRLFVKARLGEALLEIDTDVFVGHPEGALDVQARQETFDGAVIRIERRRSGDVLLPLHDDVRVNGDPVDGEIELRSDDTVTAPGVDARYQKAVRQAYRAAAPEPEKNPARTAVIALTALASAAVLVGGLLVVASTNRTPREIAERADRAERELGAVQDVPEPDKGTDPGTATSNPRENAARQMLVAAKSWIRAHPDDPEGGSQRLQEIETRYEGTAHGVLARIARQELEHRARAKADARVDDLIEDARVRAADGGLDQALLDLRNYAEDHPGTVGAERARRAMTALESEVQARFENDREAIEAAIATRNWTVAESTLSSMLDYAPVSLKDAALALRARLVAARDELLTGGPSLNDPVPEGPKGDDTAKPPPVDDKPGGADREKEALAAFKSARSDMNAGDDLEALDAFLEFLETYKDTETGKKYDQEVRARVTTLATGPAGIIRLFNGKVEERKKGRYRITYDFEDDLQLEDWRDENAFDAPPRANWKLVSGAVHAKGSGAFVFDAKFKEDFVTIAVKVRPDRAHDLGVALFEHDDIQRYFLFTLQNSFFKLGAGPGAETFRENAIILFGRNMWRDTPRGELGFVRKNGSDEPKIAPAEAITVKAGKADDQVWFRFPGGRTIRGQAQGDVPYTFKGMEPALFVLNSSGYFDDIVIEGTPDPEWVAQRWRERLSEL